MATALLSLSIIDVFDRHFLFSLSVGVVRRWPFPLYRQVSEEVNRHFPVIFKGWRDRWPLPFFVFKFLQRANGHSPLIFNYLQEVDGHFRLSLTYKYWSGGSIAITFCAQLSRVFDCHFPLTSECWSGFLITSSPLFLSIGELRWRLPLDLGASKGRIDGHVSYIFQ